jgi:hypothetical protein
MRIRRLERELDEQLPDGSSWSEAEAWYLSHGMELGYTTVPPDMQKSGLLGSIPSKTLLGLEVATIWVQVSFTDDGKLHRRRVYRTTSSL